MPMHILSSLFSVLIRSFYICIIALRSAILQCTPCMIAICILHDDVIKWKHFPRYWPFLRGIHRSPVNSSHKGRWHGALMFSLICDWINGWVNNGEAGDLRRHRTHYDANVMGILACAAVFGYKWCIFSYFTLKYQDISLYFPSVSYSLCQILIPMKLVRLNGRPNMNWQKPQTCFYYSAFHECHTAKSPAIWLFVQ